MFDYPLQPIALAVPDCYYARPLVHGLHLREDLALRFGTPDAVAEMLRDRACACALVSPTALLADGQLSVLPGAGAVARSAALSECLITSDPLHAIRHVAVADGAAPLVDYMRVLFAERGLAQPDFCAAPAGAPPDDAAVLVSGDSGLNYSDATPGHDLGTLWLETTGLPLVLGVWVCAPMAPYRVLRQVLGDAARQAEESRATLETGKHPDRHLDYRLLSLASDSIRMLHTLARRHAICGTTVESIAFC